MYISRLKLYNWKNFHSCEVKLSERSFIIGANASGKSNFLDSLRFLRDVVRQGGGLQSAVELRGGVTKIRSLAARSQTNIRIELDLSDSGADAPKWKYAIDIVNRGGGIMKNQASVNEEVVFDYTQNKEVLRRTPKTKGEDPETLLFTHLEQATTNGAFREIRDAFQTIEYLNVVPQMVREESTVFMTSYKEDYYGRNFLNRLARLNERTRNKYLRQINDVLSIAVPQLQELSFSTDERGIPHIEAKYQHWRAAGSRQNEKLFSDGTLRLIGFLFALLDGNGIILLEEPETNLHSSIVAQIPEFVARMQRQKNRQVLVTTHSYDILSNNGIGIEELIILENSVEGTIIRNAKDVENVRIMMESGLTAADVAAVQTAPMQVERINQLPT